MIVITNTINKDYCDLFVRTVLSIFSEQLHSADDTRSCMEGFSVIDYLFGSDEDCVVLPFALLHLTTCECFNVSLKRLMKLLH